MPSNSQINTKSNQLFSIEQLSQVYKSCGDILRVKILRVMKQETFGVLELAQLFETKQSGMSHHLKVLSQAKLIESQREGNAIFYRRPLRFANEQEASIANNIYESIDSIEIEPDIHTGIQMIHQQRANQSQAFFAKNVDQFQEQQELIASHDTYAEASLNLLLDSTKEETSKQTVMEIGPGEGLLLEPLCEHFHKVLALDNSKEMLARVKKTVPSQLIDNLELILGDTQYYKQGINDKKHISVDAAIMNMVLHHVPKPAQIFIDVYDCLKPGGTLVICDLSKHSQEWTKENCGDLWCGFDSDELNAWGESAGFEKDKEVYIGLRNGFQIMLRRFKKQK